MKLSDQSTHRRNLKKVDSTDLHLGFWAPHELYEMTRSSNPEMLDQLEFLCLRRLSCTMPLIETVNWSSPAEQSRIILFQSFPKVSSTLNFKQARSSVPHGKGFRGFARAWHHAIATRPVHCVGLLQRLLQ